MVGRSFLHNTLREFTQRTASRDQINVFSLQRHQQQQLTSDEHCNLDSTQLDSTLLHSPLPYSTMYLLTLMVHFVAVFANTKLVKLDFAVRAFDNKVLGDCVYSLEKENSLGARYLKQFKERDIYAVCISYTSSECTPQSASDWIQKGCVQRFDAYYLEGHAPPYGMSFHNSHGDCLYNAWGDNGGGVLNGKNSCSCAAVGVTTATC